MTVRIGTVWDSTQQVLSGRAGMLAPIAAIGIVLPAVLQLLLVPRGAAPGQMGVTGFAITLLSLVMGVWAQLAIMAVATHPATTTADASRAALGRLLPVIGVAPLALIRAVAPAVVAAAMMAGVVRLVEALLPPLAPPVQLAILVGVGAATYGGWLALFARGTVRELIAILRKRPLPA